MAYTYGQTYEEEKQEVIKFLDMQDREFFIGFVSFRFNDPCTVAIGTDSHELEQFLIADIQHWQDEVFSTCEGKDHDQLFSGTEDKLINCDCGYALDMGFDYTSIDNDALADHLLSKDGQTIVINDDFETEFFEFLSHYKDDLYGRD
jgi:hypothetical protein